MTEFDPDSPHPSTDDTSDAPRTIDVAPVAALRADLERALADVIVGQEETIRLVCITLLTRGHALLEGVPGVAKTLLVRGVAAACGVRFGRVQFTPDLMPADIIGTPILDVASGEVRFRPGPLFTDMLLADEINRAAAKTQAALLQAMQEGVATVDGTSHDLGPWFTVLATQNPIEQEGTYPLPEAEMDRFLFKIVVGYPSAEQERAIIALHHAGRRAPEDIAPVVSGEALNDLRDRVAALTVSPDVVGYAADLVRATRTASQFALGASPRAGLWLVRAAKAAAALEGRDFVLPEDVQSVHAPCLRHRVQLDPGAEIEGLGVDDALAQSLRGVSVPR
jgi:MoxR-like ATPase